jgi:hypothetical protein
VDEIEDKVLTNRISVSRTELGALRRVLVRLQRLLAPEPAALFRLLSRPPAWVGAEDVQDMREAAEEFSVAVADVVATLVALQPRWDTSRSGNFGNSGEYPLPPGLLRCMFGYLRRRTCAGSDRAMTHVTVESQPWV